MIITIQSTSSHYYYRYPLYSDQYNQKYNYECLLDIPSGEYRISVEFFGKQLIQNHQVIIENSSSGFKSMCFTKD